MGRRHKSRSFDASMLSDEEVCSTILCNWHRLNDALRLRPGLDDVERLLKLEEARDKPRANFLVRLRAVVERRRRESQ